MRLVTAIALNVQAGDAGSGDATAFGPTWVHELTLTAARLPIAPLLLAGDIARAPRVCRNDIAGRGARTVTGNPARAEARHGCVEARWEDPRETQITGSFRLVITSR